MKNAIGSDRLGAIFRGLALVILGALLLCYPVSCQSPKNKNTPEEKERTVYSDTRYRMVQGAAIHRPSPVKGREYVFIPLRLKISDSTSIIFSTRVCVTAYALPSCEACPHSHEAVTDGREHIRDFRLFDGIIYAGRETDGWLAFDLPEGTQSVHVDFSTGIQEGECMSFDCKI
ncbi:MAG: hypothetical protein IJM51_07045 [Clostridia bacterium]|nr:hypothetical protein [Clostridia bacterium]